MDRGDGSFQAGEKTLSKKELRVKMLKRKFERGVGGIADSAIATLMDQLQKGELKASAGDIVRFLQFRNESAGSPHGAVRLRWVDECQTPANEE